MTREEFDKYYANEIKTFETNLISEKERVKSLLHDKFRTDGYSDAISTREKEIELKKKV